MNYIYQKIFRSNSLKADLNPIRHLLALLGAHHILHVSRIRVDLNTMIYTHKFIINCSEYAQYLPFKDPVKSHLPFAGIIRNSPYSPR